MSEDTFEFGLDLDDSFFELKENSLYENGQLNVQLNGSRIDNTISLDLKVKGVVSTTCERCLDPIDMPLDFSYLDVVKITNDPSLLNEENYIHENRPVYSIYDSLYEHVCMELPNRLICQLSTKKEECEIPLNSSHKEETDPRWDKLKKLIK